MIRLLSTDKTRKNDKKFKQVLPGFGAQFFVANLSFYWFSQFLDLHCLILSPWSDAWAPRLDMTKTQKKYFAAIWAWKRALSRLNSTQKNLKNSNWGAQIKYFEEKVFFWVYSPSFWLKKNTRLTTTFEPPKRSSLWVAAEIGWHVVAPLAARPHPSVSSPLSILDNNGRVLAANGARRLRGSSTCCAPRYSPNDPYYRACPYVSLSSNTWDWWLVPLLCHSQPARAHTDFPKITCFFHFSGWGSDWADPSRIFLWKYRVELVQSDIYSWEYSTTSQCLSALHGQLEKVNFVLDVHRWEKNKPAHISLPYDHCPLTQHA